MTTLRTETPHPEHYRLDEYATHDLVEAFVHDQGLAAAAVRAAASDIARAVEAAVPRLHAGGRLVYVGAGTSGRPSTRCSRTSGSSRWTCPASRPRS